MSVCSELLQPNPFDFQARHKIPQDKQKLLQHYKTRLDQSEADRQGYLQRLEKTSQQLENFHKTLQSVKKLNDQVFQIQTELGEVQDSIFAERQQVLDLNRENDILKLKEKEEQRKLAQLRSMVKSNDEQTYYRDSRPKQLKKTKNSSGNVLCKAQNGPGYNKKVGKYKQNPKHQLRTVYLPNERMNTAALEVEILKKQLLEEKSVYQSELKALEEENGIRAQQSEVRAQVDFEKLKQFTRLAAIQEENGKIFTKEYFKTRYDLQQIEEFLKKYLKGLQNKTREITSQYATGKIDNRIENRQVNRVAQKKTNDYSNRFRKITMNNEQNLGVIKEEYQQLQENYNEKIMELEEDIMGFSEKYRNLVDRRKRNQQKYQREIEGLRENLRVLEEKRNRPISKRQPRQSFKPPLCVRCKQRSPYNR